MCDDETQANCFFVLLVTAQFIKHSCQWKIHKNDDSFHLCN